MDSSLISISKIFTEKLLRIPDYQRGYAWTQKEISEFWNDVCFLEEGKNHYIGVLTLEDVPSRNIENWVEDHWIIHAKSYHPYYVVDGQQRITTIIILIQSIIEEINLRDGEKTLNYTDIEDIRKKFIFEEKTRGSSRSYLFGYDKDNPSYEYLKKYIFLEESANLSVLENTIYTQNLSNAKGFFLEKLSHMELSEIELMFKKITQNLLFNSYSLDEEIDTYVAFETMNNRGKPLSHLELLKNRLIYLTTKIKEDDYHKNSLRHSINECWKSMYHFLGKDMSERLDDDVFLYHHSTMYFKNLKIKNDQIPNEERRTLNIWGVSIYLDEFESFRKFGYMNYQVKNRSMLLDDIFSAKPINDESRKHEISIEVISDYVRNLKKSVEIWYYIHNPLHSDFNPSIKEWISKINKIQNWSVSRVLLLEIFNFNYKSEDIIFALRNLERMLFIQTLIQRHLYADASAFIALALYLKQSKNISLISSKIKSSTDDMLKSEYGNITFKENFKNGDFYNWVGVKYFLYQYEFKLRSEVKSDREKLSWEEFSKTENDNDFKTIEHIFPQKSNRSYWNDLYKGMALKKKKQLKNAPGNLVPLSHRKNASLSNKPFPEKKKDYKNGCYSEIALTEFTDWGEEQILQRTVDLMYFMDTNWELNLCPPTAIKDRAKRSTFYLNFLNLNF
ncbi:DUF262 domain-containing protein [Pectobacterium brasiliense]|uniref:DUF262 domain-containing protein n=1 Tax=Pectobacterium brasiliense TaxID=180957 RepID=UPI000694A1F1|nr:DUF262 domain-containing protein [Pectobacterium brasiliense]